MTYTIQTVKQIDDSIITIVDLQLDGFNKTVEISHFRPMSLDDIDTSIKNRAISEQSTYDAINTTTSLVSQIKTGNTVNF